MDICGLGVGLVFCNVKCEDQTHPCYFLVNYFCLFRNICTVIPIVHPYPLSSSGLTPHPPPSNMFISVGFALLPFLCTGSCICFSLIWICDFSNLLILDVWEYMMNLSVMILGGGLCLVFLFIIL